MGKTIKPDYTREKSEKKCIGCGAKILDSDVTYSLKNGEICGMCQCEIESQVYK